MDKKRAEGRKQFFPRFAADATMRLIVGEGPRDAVVFRNDNGGDVYCGSTGVPQANWMLLPAGQGFSDNYSWDDWWVYAPAGSGTISGFIVQGG